MSCIWNGEGEQPTAGTGGEDIADDNAEPLGTAACRSDLHHATATNTHGAAHRTIPTPWIIDSGSWRIRAIVARAVFLWSSKARIIVAKSP